MMLILRNSTNSKKGYIQSHGSLSTDCEGQQYQVTCRRESEDSEKHRKKILDQNRKESISKLHLAKVYCTMLIQRIFEKQCKNSATYSLNFTLYNVCLKDYCVSDLPG